MSTSPHHELAILERRQCVVALYVHGHSQAAIAAKINCSTATVQEDLKEVRAAWLRQSLEQYDEKKARELAKVDNLEAEAWEAWHRSCQCHETTRTRTEQVRVLVPQGTDPPKRPVKGRKNKPQAKHRMQPVRVTTEVIVKGPTGDPRYLEQIAWCIETRLRVMGALKTDVTNVQVNQINWADMTTRPASEDVIEAVIREAESKALVTPTLPEPTSIPPSPHEPLPSHETTPPPEPHPVKPARTVKRPRRPST